MSSTPFLLTGVTGGLGAKILHDMLHVHNVPPQDIIATNRSESKRQHFESQGLQYRVLDYQRPETILPALQGVRDFFFVASPERDSGKRIAEHNNVIAAAKQAGVQRTWYNSLAFGNFDSNSKIGFQAAHYETEDLLQRSGLDFVSVRAGVYADAFPLFLNWYPSSRKVLLPKLEPPVSEGEVAFASREELGEAHATLLVKGLEAFPSIKPRGPKRIVLLTGSKAESLPALVEAINRGKGTELPVELLEPEEWIEECARNDEGGKGRGWFEARLVFSQGVVDGDAAVVDPAMETLLGRRPESGTQTVERLVKSDPGFTWHQNHVNRES